MHGGTGGSFVKPTNVPIQTYYVGIAAGGGGGGLYGGGGGGIYEFGNYTNLYASNGSDGTFGEGGYANPGGYDHIVREATASGGGGGSSYVNSTNGNSSSRFENGVREGNGYVTIRNY